MSAKSPKNVSRGDSKSSKAGADSTKSPALKLKEEGNAYYQDKDYKKAIECYSQAINIQQSPEFYTNRAAAYMLLHQYEEALKDCQSALSMDPKFRKALLRAVRCFTCLSRMDEAKQCAEKALNMYPNDNELKQSRNRIDIIQHKIQRIHEKLWPIELKFLPALVKPYYSSPHQHGGVGKTHDEDSKIETKTNESNEGESTPTNGASSTIKGVGVLTQDEKQELSLLQQTIESLLNDEMSESLYLKCLKVNVLILMQDFEQALSYATTVMRFHPQYTPLIKLRAIALFRTQNIDSAVKHTQQILKHDPDNEEVRMWFKLFRLAPRVKEEGNEAYKNGLLDEAIAKYTECIHLDPCNHGFNSVVYCNRAAVWIKKAQYQKAFDDCTICIELDPSSVKALIRRSQAALELKRFSEATSDAEKACQLDPQNSDYKRHLKHCKAELKKSKRKDYYKILEVGKETEDKELEKAFRKQAMKWHPDRYSSATEEERSAAEERFKEIGEAYEVLKDPKLRQRYDQGYDLDEIKQGAGGHFSQGGMDMSDIINLIGGMGGGGGMGGMGGHPGQFSFRFG